MLSAGCAVTLGSAPWTAFRLTLRANALMLNIDRLSTSTSAGMASNLGSFDILPFSFCLSIFGSPPLTGGCPEGVQGSPCRGLGCPQEPLFSLSPPQAASKKEEKGFFGDTPNRGRGLAALCTPA